MTSKTTNARSAIIGALLLGAVSFLGLLFTSSPAGAEPAPSAQLVFSSERANIRNEGTASATSGANNNAGNRSINAAATGQGMSGGGGGGGGVASNSASTSNSSTGNSSVRTGNAKAIGNQATTEVLQSSTSDAACCLVGMIQVADVRNIGGAIANSGGNLVAGNASTNAALSLQGASSGGSISANFADGSNASNGWADVTTGDASAAGNTSATNVAQIATAGLAGAIVGLGAVVQIAGVGNGGLGVANSGANLVGGNASINATGVLQGAVSARGPPAPTVASNFATTSNASDGTANVRTGDAWAAGNRSSTTFTQEGEAGGFDLPEGFDDLEDLFEPEVQEAIVINIGAGIANSGANIVTGNASINAALTAQGALTAETAGGSLRADNVVTNNAATTENRSDGTAGVITGSAWALGNESSVTVDGDGTVQNTGLAIATSGVNLAAGNRSTNAALTAQGAAAVELDAGSLRADNVVANNAASTPNQSNGRAGITTGNATATGNRSATSLAEATVTNTGAAVANTGANGAAGNASINGALTAQGSLVLEEDEGGVRAGSVVANNAAKNGNESDGSASIATGNASATGNLSTTTASDEAEIDNTGTAVANSGLNLATGNRSVNAALKLQVATVLETDGGSLRAEDAIAGNATLNGNRSDGTADVVTGSAGALGNQSESAIVGGATVRNIGTATANSGTNVATGNASINAALDPQIALVAEAGAGSLRVDRAIANNAAQSGSGSGGTARIVTGDAWALGNRSATNVTLSDEEGDEFDAITEVDQSVKVVNRGTATATSGNNRATGNGSVNAVANLQLGIIAETGAGRLNAGNAISNNAGSMTNASDGSASVTTGASTAIGNLSATSVAQSAGVALARFGIVLSEQEIIVRNIGEANAISGGNLATGNGAISASANLQVSSPTGDTDDAVAANFVNSGNRSGGSSSIWTGDALAVGNQSTVTACQALNSVAVCPPAVLPALPGTASPPAATPPAGGAGPGGTLPATGAPLGAQALLGLALVVLGTVLRRRAHTG